MGDYNYMYHGCMELTIEVGESPHHNIPTHNIHGIRNKFWGQNKFSYLDHARMANTLPMTTPGRLIHYL